MPQLQTPSKPPCEKVEPIVWLMFAAVLIFAAALIGISKLSPNDGQTFQVISGLLTGFSGALFMRIKPAEHKTSDLSTSVTNTSPNTSTVVVAASSSPASGENKEQGQ